MYGPPFLSFQDEEVLLKILILWFCDFQHLLQWHCHSCVGLRCRTGSQSPEFEMLTKRDFQKKIPFFCESFSLFACSFNFELSYSLFVLKEPRRFFFSKSFCFLFWIFPLVFEWIFKYYEVNTKYLEAIFHNLENIRIPSLILQQIQFIRF